MAYIIAHGTVNGYRKLTQATPVGLEQNVLADIRMEFDTTQTMLQKPAGYILQMAPNGVWISIVRLLFDGERSGNGAGFFAFSAFIPNNILIPGEIVKTTLDDLMNTYRGIIAGDFTKNLGVDWSFVEQASQRLNEQCKQRKKMALTNYVPSDKFAYVEISSPSAIPLYLEKPFQPEYGAYKAVFLGTTLQNPNRISSHTKLDIDFENEQYEIIWEGAYAEYPDVVFSRTIREKDIDKQSLCLSKRNHEMKILLYSQGKRDDDNCTLNMVVPKPTPCKRELQLYFNNREAVVSVTAKATVGTATQPIEVKDKCVLLLVGDQIDSPCRISVKASNLYQDGDYNIVPQEYINTGCRINLVEAKLVRVEIWYDNRNDTKNQRSKVKFSNRSAFDKVSFEKYYNDAQNCFELKLSKDKSFNACYSATLYSDYLNKYELFVDSTNEEHIIRYIVKKRESRNLGNAGIYGSKIQQKKIYVLVPKEMSKTQISYSTDDGIQGTLLNYKSCDEDFYEYEIGVPVNVHRSNFSFSDNDNNTLRAKICNDDKTIKILGKELWISRALAVLRNYRWEIVVASSVLLVLIAGVLFVLNWYGIINFSNRETDEQNNPITNVEKADTTGISSENLNSSFDDVYEELKQTLAEQRKAWNYETTYNVVDRYSGENGEKTADLKNNNQEAYTLLKQLSWLYKTRQFVNERKWDDLKRFLQSPDGQNYADDEKVTFLKELNNSSNRGARDLFEEKIIGDLNFSKKTYSQVKALWDNCKNSVSAPSISAESDSQSDPIPPRKQQQQANKKGNGSIDYNDL